MTHYHIHYHIRFLSFNPHTHEGCDTQTDKRPTAKISFNPHTHEGCDVTMQPIGRTRSSFNPHTHEGCDPCQMRCLLWILVSIHTPTKGVTHVRPILGRMASVSIHTPTKGVTLGNTMMLCTSFCFNPHTHEGCDRHSASSL